jgi:hypothetical protein
MVTREGVMPTNPQRAKLESELADLDQQLQAVDTAPHLPAGQRVLRKRYLQHQRKKVSLQIEIERATEVVESCKRDLEGERKRYEWAKSPDGSKILEQQEMQRERGRALGGGTHTTYPPFDRLEPKQRANQRAQSNLKSKEDALSGAQIKLSETEQQLRKLRAQDSEWKALHSQLSAPENIASLAGNEVTKYPSDFLPEARARVEAEKIRAGRDFDVAKQSARRTSEVEAHLRHYILRTFFAFTKEACSLQRWPVEKMDSECREFLRLLTIDAYYEKGYDMGGGRLRDMASHLNGSILPEVQCEFEKTPEWKQYQDALLAMAEAQMAKGKRPSNLEQAESPGMDRRAKSGKTVIGRNIDRLRKECGWSFNDLADRTGLDKKLILGHVNERKGIQPRTLKTYADAFGRGLERKVPVAELEN